MHCFCPACGNEMKLEKDGDYYCEICDVYFDPNIVKFSKVINIGPGCRACGNPVYPKCMDACPLFDN